MDGHSEQPRGAVTAPRRLRDPLPPHTPRGPGGGAVARRGADSSNGSSVAMHSSSPDLQRMEREVGKGVVEMDKVERKGFPPLTQVSVDGQHQTLIDQPQLPQPIPAINSSANWRKKSYDNRYMSIEPTPSLWDIPSFSPFSPFGPLQSLASYPWSFSQLSPLSLFPLLPQPDQYPQYPPTPLLTTDLPLQPWNSIPIPPTAQHTPPLSPDLIQATDMNTHSADLALAFREHLIQSRRGRTQQIAPPRPSGVGRATVSPVPHPVNKMTEGNSNEVLQIAESDGCEMDQMFSPRSVESIPQHLEIVVEDADVDMDMQLPDCQSDEELVELAIDFDLGELNGMQIDDEVDEKGRKCEEGRDSAPEEREREERRHMGMGWGFRGFDDSISSRGSSRNNARERKHNDKYREWDGG